MDYVALLALTAITSSAVLVIATLGLSVIFGLMGVINLAHGEFIMFGAYTTLVAVRVGVPFPLAILIAGLVTAVFGAILERFLISYLYGRLLDTLLATWGLSLVLYQLAILMFGTTTSGLSLPLRSMPIGRFSVSSYSLVLIVMAVALVAIVYLLFTRTRYGLLARAAIQNAEMASSIGVQTKNVNTLTFAIGSALAGVAGAILAPVFSITPTMGLAFVAKAFLAVVVAGPVILTGSVISAGGLGAVASSTSTFTTSVMGDILFFMVTIFLLRLFPSGITAGWRRKF